MSGKQKEIRVVFAVECGAGQGHVIPINDVWRYFSNIVGSHGGTIRGWVVAKDVIGAGKRLGVNDKGYGVTVLPAPVSTPTNAGVLREELSYADMLENLGFGRCESIRSRIDTWLNYFKRIRPTHICIDHSPGAQLATYIYQYENKCISSYLGIPFGVPPCRGNLPVFLSNAPRGYEDSLVDNQLAQTNAILKIHGVTPLDSMNLLFYQVDKIAFRSHPALDIFDRNDRCLYLGAAPFTAGMQRYRWFESDFRKETRRIFVYLPSLPDATIVKMLKQLSNRNARILVYIHGRNRDDFAAFENERLRLVSQAVDLNAISKFCDLAMVCGTVSQQQFASCGIPLVIVPQYPEQLLQAIRLQSLNIARCLTLEDISLLGMVIDKCLDNEAMKIACQQFRRDCKEKDSGNPLHQFSLTFLDFKGA